MDKLIIVLIINIIFFPLFLVDSYLLYSINNKIKFIICHSRVEGKPDPAWFLRKITMCDQISDGFGFLMAYIQQKMTVSSGTRASATKLYAKAIA
jgi:hypothetical protein